MMQAAAQLRQKLEALGYNRDDAHAAFCRTLLVVAPPEPNQVGVLAWSLLAQPQIAQAVVAGDNRPALAAIVVPSSGVSRSDVAAAIARTNASLPDYARLAGWVDAAPFTLQNGMLTGNGRPVRVAVLERHAAGLAALYSEQPVKEPTHAVL